MREPSYHQGSGAAQTPCMAFMCVSSCHWCTSFLVLSNCHIDQESFPNSLTCVCVIKIKGQRDDARMNLAIALTAARYGAAIANYTEVLHLLKRADPQTKSGEGPRSLHGRDVIAGQEFDVRAKCVINATGPFANAPQKMDDQKKSDICQPGAGVHIVILGYYRTRSAPRLEVWGAAAGIETS
ncbi:glycerol-3-phosphate dehydrogenase, mitochondrial-like isoform X2 [Synchiropus splendidus]|uniref:glycerol-3-phosphate dehydrogenase, mitochondrial-like isoform X2 n=1 Tax=Synchiropus splendidus TaxID=270530 RepID=UPI00237E168F|nr:glycerol-3-phosphate dehydrogenase, mitochondrial-like isoform X2 [Synchiropus splendidus]